MTPAGFEPALNGISTRRLFRWAMESCERRLVVPVRFTLRRLHSPRTIRSNNSGRRRTCNHPGKNRKLYLLSYGVVKGR
jgi:hypothetical protein